MFRFGLIALALSVEPFRAQVPGLTITLKDSTSATVAARAQLQRIVATYPIERWLSTRIVAIEPDAIPHSSCGVP
ncbi:MAG TPA: hypothetical protein VFU23_14875 [Gemmatimonadales bacterium]|nr:hypothetical protein [Gemmatimonadales bacterium]